MPWMSSRREWCPVRVKHALTSLISYLLDYPYTLSAPLHTYAGMVCFYLAQPVSMRKVPKPKKAKKPQGTSRRRETTADSERTEDTRRKADTDDSDEGAYQCCLMPFEHTADLQIQRTPTPRRLTRTTSDKLAAGSRVRSSSTQPKP